MKFFTRDWLDSKELRRCSVISRAILMDLMCLAHEGERYGYLEDSIGPLTDEFMAARCTVSVPELLKAVAELTKNQRLKRDGEILFVSRMVSDEEIRVKRAAGGVLGGNPKLKVNLVPNLEVNLAIKEKVNLVPNLEVKQNGDFNAESVTYELEGYPSGYPCFEIDSRAHAGADSDSYYSSSVKGEIADSSEDRFREICDGYDRHQKHSNRETRDSVVVHIAGMNGGFSWDKFRANHGKYCEYWDQKGWPYCTVTFLGWVRAGMPPPPPPSQSPRDRSDPSQPIRSNLPTVRELMDRDRKRDEEINGKA